MNKPLPSPELLRKLLRYDPETGKLFWRKRSPDLFSAKKNTADQSCASWNTRYAGRRAFTAENDFGYCVGRIFDKSYLAHRVIWAICFDEWPAEEIDHVNGRRRDNSISNLRAVSSSLNNRNCQIGKSNKSGHMGVSWAKREKKWRAHITFNRKTHHLGYFDKIEDAVSARKSADIRFGFHPNHGRQAINAAKDMIERGEA